MISNDLRMKSSFEPIIVARKARALETIAFYIAPNYDQSSTKLSIISIRAVSAEQRGAVALPLIWTQFSISGCTRSEKDSTNFQRPRRWTHCGIQNYFSIDEKNQFQILSEKCFTSRFPRKHFSRARSRRAEREFMASRLILLLLAILVLCIHLPRCNMIYVRSKCLPPAFEWVFRHPSCKRELWNMHSFIVL